MSGIASPVASPTAPLESTYACGIATSTSVQPSEHSRPVHQRFAQRDVPAAWVNGPAGWQPRHAPFFVPNWQLSGISALTGSGSPGSSASRHGSLSASPRGDRRGMSKAPGEIRPRLATLPNNETAGAPAPSVTTITNAVPSLGRGLTPSRAASAQKARKMPRGRLDSLLDVGVAAGEHELAPLRMMLASPPPDIYGLKALHIQCARARSSAPLVCPARC